MVFGVLTVLLGPMDTLQPRMLDAIAIVHELLQPVRIAIHTIKVEKSLLRGVENGIDQDDVIVIHLLVSLNNWHDAIYLI